MIFFSAGCEECMTTYLSECPEHRLQIVPDKVVLSRAWSSLPSILQIFRLGESTGKFHPTKLDKIDLSKEIAISYYL